MTLQNLIHSATGNFLLYQRSSLCQICNGQVVLSLLKFDQMMTEVVQELHMCHVSDKLHSRISEWALMGEIEWDTFSY